MATLINNQAQGDCPIKSNSKNLPTTTDNILASESILPDSNQESSEEAVGNQPQVEKKRRSGSKIPGRKNVPLIVNQKSQHQVILGELKSPSKMKKNWSKNTLNSSTEILETRAVEGSWDSNTKIARKEPAKSIFREKSSSNDNANATNTPSKSVTLKSPKSGIIRTPNKNKIQVGLFPNSNGLGCFSVNKNPNLNDSLHNLDVSSLEEPRSPQAGEKPLSSPERTLKFKHDERRRAVEFKLKQEINQLKNKLTKALNDLSSVEEEYQFKFEQILKEANESKIENQSILQDYKDFQDRTILEQTKTENQIKEKEESREKTEKKLKNWRNGSLLAAFFSVLLFCYCVYRIVVAENKAQMLEATLNKSGIKNLSSNILSWGRKLLSGSEVVSSEKMLTSDVAEL